MKKLMIIISILVGVSFNLDAQQQNRETYESDWKEIQTVQIPYGIDVMEGYTKNGNLKYWIEVDEIKIYINPKNYKGFKDKTIKLLLVEWYNPHKDVYKYTTRAMEKDNNSERLNINFNTR